MNQELKPCRFCNDDKPIFHLHVDSYGDQLYEIICTKCGYSTGELSRKDAINEWNFRFSNTEEKNNEQQ